MANTQSNSTTKQTTQSSGIYNIPELLKYPKFLNYQTHNNQVKNNLIYIMPHYGYDGLSVLIYRQPKEDNIIVICGDWNGNRIDVTDNTCILSNLASKFLTKHAAEFFKLLKLIRIEQTQLYFAIGNNGLILVDMQISLNKFASPGMLKDIFGKLCEVPEMKTEMLDDKTIESIEKSRGFYNNNLIIKPNKFKLYEENGTYRPTYLEVIK